MTAPDEPVTTEQAYVLRWPCPFCAAPSGEWCAGGEVRDERGVRGPLHVARMKRAGRAAIQEAIAARIEDRPGLHTPCAQPYANHVVTRKAGVVTMICPAIETGE